MGKSIAEVAKKIFGRRYSTECNCDEEKKDVIHDNRTFNKHGNCTPEHFVQSNATQEEKQNLLTTAVTRRDYQSCSYGCNYNVTTQVSTTTTKDHLETDVTISKEK